tara:strand:- start:61 stop:243 length:183 start_codon:yes stop_codon:yes gene_type:complete
MLGFIGHGKLKLFLFDMLKDVELFIGEPEFSQELKPIRMTAHEEGTQPAREKNWVSSERR